MVSQEQADKYGITLEELQTLAVGKSCPVHGTSEILHVRRTRGAKGQPGKVTVFNQSEKARSEAISRSKQAKAKAKVDPTVEAPTEQPTV